MNVVIPGTNKYFRMDLKSKDSVELVPIELAFRYLSEYHLLVSTIEWDWLIEGETASTTSLSGIAEGLFLDIEVKLKKEIENQLYIKKNDIIHLAYDFLADTEVYKDDTGYRRQRVTEYIVPRFIMNGRTGKAVYLDAGEINDE